jgi:signal-induced proliferation-associated 1 like protein 3
VSPVDPEVPVCEPLDGELVPELEPVSPVEPLLPVELPTPEELPVPLLPVPLLPIPLLPVELPEPVLLVSPVDEPVPVDPEVSPAPASEVLLLGEVRPLRPCAFELLPVEPDEPASEPVIP